MEKKFFTWIGFGFAVIALLGIAVAFLRIAADIIDSHKNVGDLAAWCGAIGTVGTLIGTIWLASAETRRRRASERMRAVLTAAVIGLRIAKVRILLEAIINELNEKSHQGITIEILVELGETLDAATLWSQDDAEKLVPLLNDCAAHVAYCLAQYRMLVEMLTRADRNLLLKNAEMRKQFCSETVSFIQGLLVSVRVAERECRAAIATIDVVVSRDKVAT